VSAPETTGPLPEMHYPPIMDEAAARERLAIEPFPQRLWRTAGAGFRRMECVWLPYFRLTVTLATRDSVGTLHTVVDAHAGCLAFVHTENAAVPGRPPEMAHFPPQMALEAAMKVARREITAKALGQRGQSRRPHVREIRAEGILYWPYWVYYFERRAGRLDLRFLDGLTGERPGHKLKSGLLAAFLAAAEEHTAPTRSEEESQ